MTHNIAISGSKAMAAGAGKGPGIMLDSAVGGDFAALVAGLEETSNTGALPPFGTETPETASDQDDEKPVILDLSLSAAAQSATATLIVPPPPPLIAPAPAEPATTALPQTNPAIAQAILSKPTKPVANTPVNAAPPTPRPSQVVGGMSPTIVEAGVDTTSGAATSADAAPPAQRPSPVAGEMSPTIVADIPPTVAAVSNPTPALRRQQASLGLPAKSAEATPVTSPMAVTVSAIGAAVPSSPLPSLIPVTAQPLPIDQSAFPIGTSPPQTGGDTRTAPSPLPVQVEGVASAQPQAFIPAEPAKGQPAITRAAIPLTQQPSAQSELAPPAAATQTAIQPVMSTLHRAAAAPETKPGEPMPMPIAMTADPARGDAGTGSGASSNRDSRGNAVAADPLQTSAMPAETLPGGRQFADIIQSLPPIAQSRIGPGITSPIAHTPGALVAKS